MLDWLQGFLAELGLSKAALITGVAGSLLSFKFVSDLGVFGRLTAFVGGAFAGGLLAPLAVDIFSLKAAYTGGVGFVVGALGMAVLGAALQAVRDAKLWDLIARRFGGGGSGQ